VRPRTSTQRRRKLVGDPPSCDLPV
jgi:hypothetical protein